jgi:cell division protease FtsH
MITPHSPDDIKYTFADIGGYEEAKEELANTAACIKKKPNAKVPCGFVLYGPPGTGKTMLAEAFAKAADLPFFMVRGEMLAANNVLRQELMSVTESRLKLLFNEVAKYSTKHGGRKVLLFIDEVDQMSGDNIVSGLRGSLGEGGKELKNLMGNGLSSGEYKNIILMVTLNNIR